MTYRWTPEGPVFEFESPYATENRFLVLRGWLLMACALSIVLVLLFLGRAEVDLTLLTLGAVPAEPARWPHMLAAAALALLAGFDFLQARRQRLLTLTPGQPASLMPDVPREGTGASPGLAGLLQVLQGGHPPPAALSGPFGAALRRLGPHVPAAPVPLHHYLRARMAHAALAAGLLLILALAAVAAQSLDRPAALAAGAAVLSLLALAAVARHVRAPEAPAFGRVVLAVLLVLGLAAVVLPLALAPLLPLPLPEALLRLGLPAAAASLLLGGLGVELAGLRAACGQLQPDRLAAVTGAETTLTLQAEPEPLLREVDLELHRRWTEGIPNRRYAWQAQPLGRGAGEGVFSATVVEESQPLAPRSATSAGTGRDGVLLLSALGLVFSAAGALLWTGLAVAQMRGLTSSWAAGPLGLIALMLGLYALRIAHLLWSRVELESVITWLDLKGDYVRPPQDAGPAGQGGARPPPRMAALKVQARVALARSVFYAAAPYRLGSRVLVHVVGDPKASAGWIGILTDQARALSAAADTVRQPAAATAAAAPRPAAREPRAREAAAAPRQPARFCSACGTPVLQGARFCQHCGTVLTAE